MKETVLIAIGGNAILKAEDKGTGEEQYKNVLNISNSILDLIEEGYKVVITHGNGPQVGNALLKNEAGKEITAPHSLDICVSETQGSIGYIIERALINQMAKRNIKYNLATILTQVIVDENDEAFNNPTKFVGPFFSKEEAEGKSKIDGAKYLKDSNRGYRKVVASPKPLGIVELTGIKTLIEGDILVIAGGGGGIPVIETEEGLKGIDAVIDKDYTSALIGKKIDADYLVLATAVEQVCINFGEENETKLSSITANEAMEYLNSGQFPRGSMGPKVEAAIEFIKDSERKAIITSIDKLKEALRGETGTYISYE